MYLRLDSFPALELPESFQFCTPQEIYINIPLEEEGVFSWSTGGSDSIVWIDDNLELTGFLENSCGIAEASIQFEMIDCEKLPPFPNAFSPNNDGVNDSFIADLKGYSVLDWIIYDRWGNKLASLSTENSGISSQIIWDGMCQGQILNPGVYVFVANIKHEISQESRYISGSITLLK
jgi:gliding motility-associated-like protein